MSRFPSTMWLTIVVTLVGLPRTVSAAQTADPDRATQQALRDITRSLATAQLRKDEPQVRELAAQAFELLRESAGTPEVPDEYLAPPEAVPPLTAAEARAGFDKLLRFVQRHRWWKIGLDPMQTEHLPREVAGMLTGCLAGCRAGVPRRDELLAEAVAAGDYLLWTQTAGGTGGIPFPAFRGGSNRAFESAERFLRAAESAGRWNDVVKNGWAVDDLSDGGLQFDNGLCGVALLELYEVTGERRFLEGGLAAADWTISRPCVTNWNYNSFSVYLLATAYRHSHDPRHLAAAREKARLGVLPGQLLDGPRAGRWADPHNARPAYHYIMLRGLTALLAALPADDPDRTRLAGAIALGMQARNGEFAARGVMNVDSALESLLLFQSLPDETRQAIGPCGVDEALAVLERHCTTRLRRGESPCSPGVGGRYFEWVLAP
jgi:hypothetical protein